MKFETLEDRCVPAVLADEQMYIYLLNRARNNPVQYQLENNLSVSLAGVAARQPLALNSQLMNSSGLKAEEMARFDYFAHQSAATGKLPNQIVREAGYQLPTEFPNDQNWVESLQAGYADPRLSLNYLLVDDGIAGASHRVQLLGMNDFFAQDTEVGVGFGFNASSKFKSYWAIHTAYQTTTDRFLTGVIYNDLNKNQRYDSGEGLSGVAVTVGSTVISTNEAGGWSAKVAPGVYTVRAFGGAYKGMGLASVTVGAANVEVDFISGDPVGFTNFSRSALPGNFRMNMGDDIVGRNSGQWWAAESTASGFANRYLGAWSPGVTWVDVQSADFNADGLTDVVGRDNSNGQWWMALGSSTGFKMQLWSAWSAGVVWSSVFAGDVNGDGRADIIGRELTSGTWYVGLSTGTSFNTVAFGSFAASTTWQDMQVGDFNGDGLADVAGRSTATGEWTVGVSTGYGFIPTTFGKWSPGVQWQDTQVGDFNGDGRADIAGRLAINGQWWGAISTGTGFTNTLLTSWSAAAGWIDVRVGDFNGDGKSDLLGRVPTTGETYVSVATAPNAAFATSLYAVWSNSIIWQDVRIIDVNKDGKADLVGRTPNTGDWYAGISTGSTFITRYNGTWSPIGWADVKVGSYSTTSSASRPTSTSSANATGAARPANFAFSAVDAYMAELADNDNR